MRPVGLWIPAPVVSGRALLWGPGWFALEVAVLWVDPQLLVLVLAVLGGMAAWQTARAWADAGEDVEPAVAAMITIAVVLASTIGPAGAGAATLAAVVVSLLAPVGLQSGRGPNDPGDPLVASAGLLVQSWLPAVAAAVPLALLADRAEGAGAVFSLLCLLGIYDAGHHLVGMSAIHAWEGPLAGVVGMVVVTGALVVVGVPPMDVDTLVRYSVATMVLAPLGEVLGSLSTPAALGPGPALRRLDSLIAAGPVWTFLVWGYLNTL